VREKKERAITQGKRYVGVRGVCLEESPIVEEEMEIVKKKECFFESFDTLCLCVRMLLKKKWFGKKGNSFHVMVEASHVLVKKGSKFIFFRHEKREGKLR
jgi:hypothetical protein